MDTLKLCGNYKSDIKTLDTVLKIKNSFDIVKRELTLSDGKCASLYFIDGLIKDNVMSKILDFVVSSGSDTNAIDEIPYGEVDHSKDTVFISYMFFSGAAVLLREEKDFAYIIDTRQYPVRSIEEPENDRVLRGPHEGFVETLIVNTALIRRRIRCSELCIELVNSGGVSKTDIALCYMKSKADIKAVGSLKNKLENLKVNSVNMGIQSLAECLVKGATLNPFPKFRYTERPDTAAAMISEGSILLLCDNSPLAMILPTSVFDFLQTSDDFYFPPPVGSYLRILRLCVFIFSFLLLPSWYLLLNHPDVFNGALKIFTLEGQSCPIPVFVQILTVELIIDGLKMASLNTPSSLTNSLSIVGGLILGDFAVSAGWLAPQVIIFMAFVAIANFTQQSYELGYAIKFMRIMLLCLTALFDIYGYTAGLVLTVIIVATNKTVDGTRGYLYPLVPFDGKAILRLLFRVKLK